MAMIKRALPRAPEPTKRYRYNKPVTDIARVAAVPEPKTHRYHVFTEEEKKEIFEAREKGWPYALIAHQHDTTSDTIRHLVCREKKRRKEA